MCSTGLVTNPPQAPHLSLQCIILPWCIFGVFLIFHGTPQAQNRTNQAHLPVPDWLHFEIKVPNPVFDNILKSCACSFSVFDTIATTMITCRKKSGGKLFISCNALHYRENCLGRILLSCNRVAVAHPRSSAGITLHEIIQFFFSLSM